MTPLDLSQRPPRSCQLELDGIAYLPRAIDKVRAQLPGGNGGAYIVLREGLTTISSLFYRKLGLAHDDFVAAVRDAGDENEVAAWLRARVDVAALAQWNAQLFGIRLGDLPPETRARVVASHPVAATMPDATRLVDVFDADDAALFSSAG